MAPTICAWGQIVGATPWVQFYFFMRRLNGCQGTWGDVLFLSRIAGMVDMPVSRRRIRLEGWD